MLNRGQLYPSSMSSAVFETMNPPRPFRREYTAHGPTQSSVFIVQRNSKFRSDLGILSLALAGSYTWIAEELTLLTTRNEFIVVIMVFAT